MRTLYRLGLPLLAALLLFACQEDNGPISDPIPQGEWKRTTALPDGREHRSAIFLERDSAFITDTILSHVGGTVNVDSTHAIQLELTTAGDGYFRAVEEHTVGGSDIIRHELRYWYFYTKNDSLYFYRGMRLRGRNIDLQGNWNLSAADSAFLGESWNYNFTSTTVTVTRISPTGIETHTYPYQIGHDSLQIAGAASPFYGERFEIIPGLALYITSHRGIGYGKKE